MKVKVIKSVMVLKIFFIAVVMLFNSFAMSFDDSVAVFSKIEFKELLPKSTVNDIAFDEAKNEDENSIWFSTYGQGIFKYIPSEDKWINYSTKNENIDNDLFYCIAVSNEYVWAGTSDGLYILDRKRDVWKKRKFAMGGEFGNWIRSLCYDPSEDVLYIGRFRNITKLLVAKQKYEDYDLTIGTEQKTNTFKTIRLEGDSYVWFGTESGAFRYDKKKDLNEKKPYQYFGNKNNAFRNEGEYVSINDFLFDKNFIWFATDEFITRENPNFNVGGLYKFNRRATWERIDTRGGLPGQGIYTMEKCGNYLWVSTYHFDKKEKKDYGRGIVLVNRRTNKVIKINPDEIRLASNKVLSLYFDNNYMWIGTDSGLWKVRISNELAKFNTKK